MYIFLKTIIYILILFCANAFQTYAQSFHSIHLHKDNGLPANEVYDIHQDKKGFIWIACEKGLVRYDGSYYKTFYNQDLLYAPGSCIKEDRLGRIWYENFDGQLYYVLNDSLITFKQNKLYNFYPFGITDKYLFHTQNEKTVVYDIESLHLQKELDNKKIEILGTISNASNYYILQETQLIKLNDNLKPIAKNNEGKRINWFSKIYYDNNYLFLTNKQDNSNEILVLDTLLNAVTTLKIPKNIFVHQCAFIDSSFWILTFDGIYKFGINGQFNNHIFSGKSISKIIKDKDNNFWFASNKTGIYFIPNFEDKYYPIDEFVAKRIFRFRDNIYLIDEQNKFYSANLNQINTFKHEFTNPITSPIHFATIDTLQSCFIYASFGASIISIPDFRQVKHVAASIKDICSIDEKYWGIASNGFYGLMLKSNKNITSSWDNQYNIGIKMLSENAVKIDKENVRARCIVYNRHHHTLYASGNTGLMKFTANNEKEILNNGKKFYAQKLFAYHQDVYALDTKGILYLIKNGVQFVNLSESLDLQSQCINKIKLYGDYFFFLTDKLAYQYNLLNGTLKALNLYVNLNEINDFVINGDSLLLLTNNAIVLKKIKEEPLLSDTKIYINNVSIEDKKHNVLQSIIVPNTTQKIQIEYAVPEFGKTIKTNIFYKLNDGKWNATPAGTNVLELLSLPEGNHTLYFKVGNTIQDQTIQFNVQSPYWKRWWFMALVLLLMISIAWLIYYFRIKRLNSQISHLEEKITLEQELGKSIVKSVKAQMNPHFFYNALNTIQAYIYTNDKLNAGKYLSKFSKLTRKILEMTEKEYIVLTEEINTLKLYLELEKMRFEEELIVNFNVDDNIETDFVKIPTMLIQPYVENAIKHGLLHKLGKDKTINLHFEIQAEKLQITIDDNGIGRKKSTEINNIKFKHHQSFSTEANNKRIEILNKHNTQKIEVQFIDKYDENEVAKGTSVILTIPIMSKKIN